LGELNEINAIGINTDEILSDTRILKSGVFRCRAGITANMPEGASGTYILISRKCYKNNEYMIYEIYGLNNSYRGTCRKIDENFSSWQSF
uniref:hypothetical protein n=1 Tax=uncultured Bacteroides sp. TaxID=162156 RepID=UPI0026313263